jgi:hypothetical protein
MFKKGSYWVYLNENTGSIDTNYIYEDEKIYYYPDSPPQYENIYMNFSSVFIKRYLIYIDHFDNSFLRIELNNNNTYIESEVLSESVAQGRSNQVTDECRLVANHNTLKVNGNNFSHVLQTQDSSSISNVKFVTNLYFVKNVGLIKIESKDENSEIVWSLLKWHVIQ